MEGWPSINAGDLRHSVTIQRKSVTQDAIGQQLDTPTTVLTTRGGYNLVSMREAFANNQQTSQQSGIWTIRWTSTTILAGMTLIVGGETFTIQAVNNFEKRRILIHLLCQELGAPSA